ncbi:unnamed protein product, partial [Ectocarpus sp. 12 AP-2014]
QCARPAADVQDCNLLSTSSSMHSSRWTPSREQSFDLLNKHVALNMPLRHCLLTAIIFSRGIHFVPVRRRRKVLHAYPQRAACPAAPSAADSLTAALDNHRKKGFGRKGPMACCKERRQWWRWDHSIRGYGRKPS